VDCKSAASPSRLPGLDWAINPYRGCAHACAYCYSQDVTRFETDEPWGEVVEVKANIVRQLRRELQRGPRGVYGVGTVTDPYQPLERRHELTRGCLSALRRVGAEVSVLTKSALVLRDLDLLVGWAGAEVGISIASMDADVASVVEPGAPRPCERARALAELSSSGVRTYLMMAPVIAGLSDSKENIAGVVGTASEAGVGYIMWDKFNRKPMAASRLQEALARAGLEAPCELTRTEEARVRALLKEECGKAGIKLVDAF